MRKVIVVNGCKRVLDHNLHSISLGILYLMGNIANLWNLEGDRSFGVRIGLAYSIPYSNWCLYLKVPEY